MEELLTQLGLNEKEARFYLGLLELKPKTASQIAKHFKESRTNTYMVMEELEKLELVTVDETNPVRRYQATAPEKLQELLQQKQQQLQLTQNSLSSVMQELTSLYALGQHKPGVSYLEGVAGYKKMLESCANSNEDVLIIGASEVPVRTGYNDILLKGLAKRRARGIHSKMILSKENCADVDTQHYLEARGQEVRFWGDEPFKSEIVVYEDKLILTVYEPELINVVLTNSIIATTFKTIFNQIWDQEKKTKSKSTN